MAAIDQNSDFRNDLFRILCRFHYSVELLGVVSEAWVRVRLGVAHLFVLSSLAEGIAAVMEAMALEMPVIATDVGGMAELMQNGVGGLWVQPEQPEALANAIETVH